MTHKIPNKTALLRTTVLCLITCLVTIAGLFLLYLYDNKYTMDFHTQQSKRESAKMDIFFGDKAYFLASGWKLYPDLLLYPQDLHNTSYKAADTYIGQYPSLASFHQNADPYGEATYRFSFSLPHDRPQTLSLLLPEIFSAARIYVNGRLAGSVGSIEPYQPYIREFIITFLTEENNEILIQTSNHSHYYGGLYYPPALGTSEALRRIQSLRMISYGLAGFSSLSIAVFSICLWLLRRRSSDSHQALYFGILSVSFGLGITYPFYRTLGVSPIRTLYAFEDTMAFLGICMALIITAQLAGVNRRPFFSRILLPAAYAMCFASFFIPVFVLPALPAFTAVYGIIVSVYKLFSACVMIAFAIRSVLSQGTGALPLYGTLCYGICLSANVIHINYYEPVRTLWQDEYGKFILVLCFAVIMVKQNYHLVRENERLHEHLEEEVAAQTQTITALVTERQQLISELLHDIKAPVSSIDACLQLIRGNRIMVNEDTDKKLALMQERCQDVSTRMQFMQALTTQDNLSFQLHPVELAGFLSRFHQKNQPDVEMTGPDFHLMLHCTCSINGEEEKLERILQNLLFNALRFTPPGGVITLELKKEGAMAAIILSDNGSGIAPSQLEHLFDKYYTTRASGGGQGLGLFITKKLTEELGGTITAESRVGIGSTFTVRFPVSS